MIAAAVTEAAEAHGYRGGFAVEISIPGGEELAKRTYNPRLGIVGGISVTSMQLTFITQRVTRFTLWMSLMTAMPRQQ